MIKSLKNIKSKTQNNVNHMNNGQESEIETLQNALQEAMLRERQLIQEKAHREDEMKQQRDASKQYIELLLKEKQELKDKLLENTQNTASVSPPSNPPPPTPPTPTPIPTPSPNIKQLEIEAEQNKKDLQRVLQKLSQREYEHNQFNEEISKLKLSLKEKTNENILYKSRYEEIEKNYRITKDKLETAQQKIEKATNDQQQFHETQTLLRSITNELKEIGEKNKIIQQEKENLKDELNDKLNEIQQLNLKIDQINLQNANYNGTIQELTVKLEDLSKKGKQQIDELINENETYKENINDLNLEIKELKQEKEDEESKYNESVEHLNEEIKQLNENIIEMEQKHEIEINDLNSKINEIEIEFKIKEKKKNKLIKELQDQLKKEVIKSQESKCKVLNLNDELLDIKQKNERLIIELQESNQEQQQQQTQKQKQKHHNHHNNGKLKSSSFVEKEVSGALAKKLEIEVKSNFALKEQIKYLTESIQQLHIDLDNKKTVINNLTKRIDIGALPTIDHNKKHSKQSKHSKNNQTSISQLQLLMQETILQNTMLRRDLDTMGRALQTAHNEIKTLQTPQTKTQND